MRPDFDDCFPLRLSRVHEVCGPGAIAFAAIAAPPEGPILWLREAWRSDMLNPSGLLPFLDPSRLLLAKSPGQIDSLAVAEEALRDGAIPVVILEITKPLNLREGRRLQLAAGTGGTIGLCIIPEEMGSNAAETRWRAAPVLDGGQQDSTLMRWEIIKNKSGTHGAWNVRWDTETRNLHVVSPAGQRPGPARARLRVPLRWSASRTTPTACPA